MRSLVIAAVALSLIAPNARADVRYIYDDCGRLHQVIDDQGNVATYTYDAVGSILSITRTTGGVGAPSITGITPASSNLRAQPITITISGENLQGGAVTTDNPGIAVSNTRTTPTSITTSFTVGFIATPGPATVTVTTSIGTATTTFTVATPPPHINALTPNSGPETRLVRISGTGLRRALRTTTYGSTGS